MVKIKSLFYLLLLISFSITKAQNSINNFDIQSQNFIKYNKNMINPTLSLFNTKKTQFVLHYRNQWAEVNDAPKTYWLNYTGNNYEKSGYGVSIFQKTVGVWKGFGGVVNYAKGINISEESILSIGFNLVSYNADLNRGKIIVGEEDPLLNNFQKTNTLSINPGISLQLSRFNLGVYADNLYDYNFSIKKMQTSFSDKTYSGHLMYKSGNSEASNVFENSNVTLMARAKHTNNIDIEYTGNILYDAPKIGWAQGTYNSFYGASVGLGFYVSKNISIGYNYENAIKSTIATLGSTHEIYFAFSFGDNDKEISSPPLTAEERKTLEQEEIKRYKKNVYTKDIIADDTASRNKLQEFVRMVEAEKLNYLLLPEKNTGVKKGYYLIAKVYDSKINADNKLSGLKQAGFKKSDLFTTESGGLHYIYLERYDKLEDAKKAYSSSYNNKYKEIIWLMPIL